MFERDTSTATHKGEQQHLVDQEIETGFKVFAEKELLWQIKTTKDISLI